MKPVISPHGVSWSLDCRVEDWLQRLPIQAASALNAWLESADNHPGDELTLTVPARVIALWPEAAAVQLGLPANQPLTFDVRLSGVMGKPGTSIQVRWLQPGKTIGAKDVTVDGLWLTYRAQTYRIPDPAFAVLGLIERFNTAEGADIDEQFRLWSEMRNVLGDQVADHLTDGFLRSLRVVSASALTFSITTDEHGDIQLAPVLLASMERVTETGDSSVSRVLSESDEALFPNRLDQLREGAPAFPLSQGLYVVADEPLRRALSAVKKLRQAPPDLRKRAAMHPEAVIREVMGVDINEPTVFVETEKFAERVLDLGEWVAPVLPWVKISSQSWGAPVSAGIRIGDVEMPLDLAAVEQALADMERAQADGLSETVISGRAVPVIPANVDALKKLKKALSLPPEKPEADQGLPEALKNVLIIETNFDDASFNRTTSGHRVGVPSLPHALKTDPKPHQRSGLNWLRQHWIEGSKGAMLCDDMGLGKTFQALTFCLWLRELMEEGVLPRKPLLLVAPVGLLRNWEAEIHEHLHHPGLGELVRAYGDHLKVLRRGRHVDGTAGLDTARLSSADVVLANYETISDYQLSFGAVSFAAAVFDEAQKIKSPKARMTHAAKALNVDFSVAMTGTPIENRLADLWCIADAVQPGALGDLKTFSLRYEVEGGDVTSLRSAVWQDESEIRSLPKLLLRRLKSDKLEGLPEKHEHVLKVQMPPKQVEVYERELAIGELNGPGGTLGMIHGLRRASLHPSLVGMTGRADLELAVEDSARFIAMLQILDDVSKRGEKALVFLESLDLQEVDQLPTLLQRRYGLSAPPMVINGQIGTENRQRRVDKFQRETGFDVMLLSPKAGGVGLTLTSANHVIHLSRWWNPAVEDQCSDRVYRIGQIKPVHIYYPLALLPDAQEHSFDWQLQVLMDRKRKLARNLLEAPNFSRQDYDDLLKGVGKH